MIHLSAPYCHKFGLAIKDSIANKQGLQKITKDE
ncbi:MAG: hypothetical protein ACI86X_001082 [Moritella sp.]|jgi:hypothetical protein